ncbi:MAG: sigma-70 family RNA polymerase sigma factor [Pirellulales bacterium]
MNSESAPHPSMGFWSRTSTNFLRALRSKDDAAWERILARACWHVFAVAGAAGLSPEDAEDVIQDVLLTASKSLPSFEPNGRRGAFRAWLNTIVRRRLADKCRERRACLDLATGSADANRLLAKLAGHSSDQDLPSRTMISEEVLTKVRSTCAPETWEAFTRQVYEGWSAERVANELSITLNQAYLAKSRIIRRLRDAIDRKGQAP